jgi:hypothetical protein
LADFVLEDEIGTRHIEKSAGGSERAARSRCEMRTKRRDRLAPPRREA